MINPHTVVKKIHPNPVLRGPHGPRGLFQDEGEGAEGNTVVNHSKYVTIGAFNNSH